MDITLQSPLSPVVLPPAQFLRPERPDELLQGFLNVDGSQNLVAARLTQQELQAYSQRQFFAADPNSNVAGYLHTNFANISRLDGDAGSISANDLVQLRQGLPPAPVQPPVVPPPPPQNQQVFQLFAQLMQMMVQLLSSLFQR